MSGILFVLFVLALSLYLFVWRPNVKATRERMRELAAERARDEHRRMHPTLYR